MTPETRAAVQALLEKATPIEHANALYRGEEERTLIADFYHEADRELFVALRIHLPALLAGEARLAALEAWATAGVTKNDCWKPDNCDNMGGICPYHHVLALLSHGADRKEAKHHG